MSTVISLRVQARAHRRFCAHAQERGARVVEHRLFLRSHHLPTWVAKIESVTLALGYDMEDVLNKARDVMDECNVSPAYRDSLSVFRLTPEAALVAVQSLCSNAQLEEEADETRLS